MSLPVSTVSHIGIGRCPNHESPRTYVTTFVSGSPNVLTNSLPTAILSAIGVSSCGHPTVALSGSSTVLTNSLPTHRVSDIGINYGMYTTLSGSPNVLAGG